MFKRHFYERQWSVGIFEQRTNEKIDIVPYDIKYQNVLDRLKKTEVNKSCGVDNLNPALLKDCESAFAIPLTFIFKDSLELELPSTSPTSSTNKVCKCNPSSKSEKMLPGNYLQISLSVIACKIVEGIVRTEIKFFLFKFNLLSKEQHKSFKNNYCTTKLLETVDFISSSCPEDKGCPVDVILLNFAKAFDTVSQRLLLKLSCNGISVLTLKWIEAFLSEF